MQQQLFKPDVNFVSAFNSGDASSPQFSSYQSPASTGQLLSSSQYQYNENELQDEYVTAASQNVQSYEPYSTTSSSKPYSTPISTEEYSNLYHLNQINGEQSQPRYDEYAQRQAENDRILAQANQELLQNQQLMQQQQQNEISAHEQHQQLLANHFGNNNSGTGMRIYYPDEDDSSNLQIQQRSDDDISLDNFSTENSSNEESVQLTSPHDSSTESIESS